jgi:predicted DNA-binding ArsR family transcriptional regulator
MNKTQVDDWRVNMQSRLEELTVLNAKQSSDMHYVKESLDEVKTLIKEQNGRVRELEGGMSGIKAIGGMLSVVFSSLFGYLFTKG